MMYRVRHNYTVRAGGGPHTWYDVVYVPDQAVERERIHTDNKVYFETFNAAQAVAFERNREPEPGSPPAKIDQGSVVKLRSGGPAMTVELIEPETEQGQWCICSWFNEHGVPYHLKFQAKALDLQNGAD